MRARKAWFPCWVLGVSAILAAGIGWHTLAMANPSKPSSAGTGRDKARVVKALGELPLSFIENKGQVDARVRYYVRTGGQTLWFTDEGIVFDIVRNVQSANSGDGGQGEGDGSGGSGSLQPPSSDNYGRLVFRQEIVGGRKASRIETKGVLPGAAHFFLGNDPAKWRTDAKTFREVYYHEIYQGIDLKLYGNGRDLEQEFIVRPGADPSRIRVAYKGVEGLQVAEDGSLIIHTAFGDLRESKPRIYQEMDGRRVEVSGRFRIVGESMYAFDVGPHHPLYTLVIDPTLSYSTYLGGSGNDYSLDVAVDTAGSAHVIGWTESLNFPTQIPYQGAYAGNRDVFITKLNATGSTLIFSTYLGGSNDEYGRKIAVDYSGNVYVSGGTWSANFPTLNPYQGANAGESDAFVAKLSASGSLLYSTYLGGSVFDWSLGIAVYPDIPDKVYVTGMTRSSDFPTTSGAYDRSCGSDGTCNGALMEGFVAKLDTSQTGASSIVYSTFLGGSGDDFGRNVAADTSGIAYVVGATTSTDFPTVNPFRGSNSGDYDVFVTKVNPTGSALIYSSYLGGSGFDRSKGLALDSAGNVYVTGDTYSSNFPVQNPYQGSYGGNGDGFVTKLNAAGSALLYSTYLGGSDNDSGWGIGADDLGNAYISGWTWSTNFPAVNPIQAANAGIPDAVVAKIDTTQSGAASLVYSTYLGGSGRDWAYGMSLDGAGNVYLVGETESTNFPTMNPIQASHAGGVTDVFVAKIAEVADLAVNKVDSPDPVFAGSPLTYLITVTNNGPGPATGVTLTDTLPGGVTFGLATPSQGICSGASTVTCNLGGLAAGISATVQIVVTPTAAGGLSNTATVTANESDPGTANNSATAVTTVNLPRYTLTVNGAGTGTGTVTGTGIACTSTAGLTSGDCIEVFDAGASVALAAAPTAGSLFAGWGGDADCADGQVTVTADKSCTATFNAASSCAGTGRYRWAGKVVTRRTGIAGVTMTLAGPNGCTTTAVTDAYGKYKFSKLGEGTYTVTPAKAGCAFTPGSSTQAIAGASVKAKFTGSCP